MAQQLRTFQSNMSGGELAPAMYSRTDVSKYQSGLKLGRNVTLKPQGGARSRNGFLIVGEVADSGFRGRTYPFNVGPGESYVLEFGEDVLRFIRDGAYILDAAAQKTITGVTDATPAVFTAAAHGFSNGRRVFVTLPQAGGEAVDSRFLTVASATTDTFTLVDEWGVAVGVDTALTTGTVTPDYRLTTPYDEGEQLGFTQDQGVMYLFSHFHAPQRLTRIAPDNWTLVAETFAPDVAAPGGVAATALVGSGSTTYQYKVSAIDGDTNEESLASATASVNNDLTTVDNKNKVTWSAVTGASRYIIYKEDNGVFGFIGGTTGLSFEDENIIPDLADTPQQPRNPFTGAGNYPKTGTFFEQRLVTANTVNNPAGVWASQSTNPRNFGVSSPLKASDAISFRVRAAQVTEIEALVPADLLLMLTTGGEWTVNGGNQEDFLTPTNIVLRQRAFRGSDPVPPLLIGDIIMHAQRGGSAVRDLLLRRETPSTEISLLARHLFEGRTITSWAYAQAPDSIVWCTLDNGDLLCLTYLLEHEIWGWTKMELGGDAFVENVVTVNEAAADAVYIQTRRTINSQTKRYMERLKTAEPTQSADAYHVDAGLQVLFGTPTNVVYGLSHLEGETLVATVDGNVVRDLEVTGGRVDLPIDGTKISIGLPYTARILTLDLDLGATRDLGSLLGRYKTMTEVTLQVEKTRGIFIAHENADLAVEHRQRAEEDWDEAIALFTGSITITPEPDWTQGGGLLIEQRDPLPMTVNGVLVDWEFGE